MTLCFKVMTRIDWQNIKVRVKNKAAWCLGVMLSYFCFARWLILKSGKVQKDLGEKLMKFVMSDNLFVQAESY